MTGLEVLGRDLLATYGVTDGRHEDVDLGTATSLGATGRTTDLVDTAGIDNAVQAVIHRIKTVRGELADLGHPEYGSRHHELIGQPNTEGNRNLVKLFVLQALAMEPRIRKVLRAAVRTDAQRDLVAIELTITFVDSAVPRDLVVPFSFRGPS